MVDTFCLIVLHWSCIGISTKRCSWRGNNEIGLMALLSISDKYLCLNQLRCVVVKLPDCVFLTPLSLYYRYLVVGWLHPILGWGLWRKRKHPKLESPKQPGFRLVRNQRDVMDPVYTFTTTEGLISVTFNGCAHTSWGQWSFFKEHTADV